MTATNSIPAYDDLPFLGSSTERHAWDVWGRGDSLGTLNRIGPTEVIAGTRLVTDGCVVSLDLPIDEPSPGLFPDRPTVRRTEFAHSSGKDDRLDGFHPQGSSQWDGFRHIHSFTHQYWGGVDAETVDSSHMLGVEHWAAKGMIGRGVLVDVADHLLQAGTPLDQQSALSIDVDLICEVLDAQAIDLCPGDFLLIRTGWIEWYRSSSKELKASLRGTVGTTFACPGLASSQDTARFLWNSGIAAIAADNPALEVLPVVPGRTAGFLHRRLLPLLGLPIGELWNLASLSDECRSRKRWEFLLTSGVMQIPGGVGSPSNAHAVF